MIRSTGGGKYAVYSHKSGRRLSKPGSKTKAMKDLKRIKSHSRSTK